MNELLAFTTFLGGASCASATGTAISGAVIGALSMLLYARVSPQIRVAQLRAELVKAQSALKGYDDSDVRVVWDMTRHALSLSLQQLRLIVVPTICTVLFVLSAAWLVDVAFDYSDLCWADSLRPAWLFSGHTVFWVPLTVVAIVVKWKHSIR